VDSPHLLSLGIDQIRLHDPEGFHRIQVFDTLHDGRVASVHYEHSVISVKGTIIAMIRDWLFTKDSYCMML
jgi:hypothetical protein